MSLKPPPFQEAERCDVCKCSFNAFRRRHHCRSCGKTLCHDHSSNQMTLPRFGIHSSVRVCYDCFNNSSRSSEDGPQASSASIDTTTHAFSGLNVTEDADTKAGSDLKQQNPGTDVLECKCGMPLCICEAPAPVPNPIPLQMQRASTVSAQPIPKPKRINNYSKDISSASNNKASSFFSLGQLANGNLDKPSTDYDVNGEGLREAIKNGDTAAVKKLLAEGVDANYCDKKGFSLLHLAAVFNQTEIAFLLMDHGASMDCKNQQGETPLDCAPTTLQYKMKKKVEEGT